MTCSCYPIKECSGCSLTKPLDPLCIHCTTQWWLRYSSHDEMCLFYVSNVFVRSRKSFHLCSVFWVQCDHGWTRAEIGMTGLTVDENVSCYGDSAFIAFSLCGSIATNALLAPLGLRKPRGAFSSFMQTAFPYVAKCVFTRVISLKQASCLCFA